jgi:cytosine/adenosine deaminase-related metal-dependent hydrolase
VKLLIRGGTVLTMARSNLEQGDVLVEDGLVTEVGTGLRARGADVIEADGAIVMPGFVDAHHHVSDTIFRHAGSAAALGRAALSPDDLHAITLAGLLAAAHAGTTTIADWAAPAITPEHADAVLSAHEAAGLRSVVVVPVGNEGRSVLRHAAARQRPDRVHVAAGHDMGPDPASWSPAEGVDVRTHVHGLAAAGDAARLAERGMLSPQTVLTDCAHLDDADLDAIAAAGASIVLTAASQMTAGLGVPPVQGIVDRGMRPALGVGSVAETPGDAFAQMRTVISIQHATVFDRKLLGKAGLPKLMTTREIIRHATVDGAAALGLGSVTGTIEPGMQGDLVVFATDRPNIHPINDPIGAVVWGMDTSNVSAVVVGGRILKREGRLVADASTARRAALGVSERLAAAGVRG